MTEGRAPLGFVCPGAVMRSLQSAFIESPGIENLLQFLKASSVDKVGNLQVEGPIWPSSDVQYLIRVTERGCHHFIIPVAEDQLYGTLAEFPCQPESSPELLD